MLCCEKRSCRKCKDRSSMTSHWDWRLSPEEPSNRRNPHVSVWRYPVVMRQSKTRVRGKAPRSGHG